MVIATLVLGLVILTVGAEFLVRGASRLAAAAGVSALVVGLTIVAYGTSAPEMVVSAQASLAGQPDVALGNVVGSNIFNVLFILGISALIIPLGVSEQLIRFEVPLMIGLSCAVLVLGYDGRIGRFDGIALVAGILAYTVWVVVKSRQEAAEVQAEYAAEFDGRAHRITVSYVLRQVGMLTLGLLLLILGSRWFVQAAILIARDLGISELVIGLTIVAAGTSLPEVATSIVAALRGERDIAVGNVVGSNIFNIMGVLGVAGMISSEGVMVSDVALRLDIPVMIAVAVACLPIFFTGHKISRWEGAIFLAYYAAYTTHLVLAATVPSVTRTFAVVLLGFVLPLTTIGLAISVMRAVRRRGEATASP